MRYKLFACSLPPDPGVEAELNGFLASHRILCVTHHVVPRLDGACLLFVVEYLDRAGADKERAEGERVDYREKLSAADFEVFRRYERLAILAREAPAWIQACLDLRVKHGGELNRCRRGLPFLGCVVYPGRLRLGKAACLRFGRKLRALERLCRHGEVGEGELQVRGTALCAAAAAANTAGLRAAAVGRGMVLPGYA